MKIIGLILLGLVFLNVGAAVTCVNESATAVCGWSALFNEGNPVKAAFVMFDSAFIGWTVVILFIVYQFMVYMKTRTLTASLVIGMLFLSLYFGASRLSATGYPYLKPLAGQVLMVILAIELAAIIYYWYWK